MSIFGIFKEFDKIKSGQDYDIGGMKRTTIEGNTDQPQSQSDPKSDTQSKPKDQTEDESTQSESSQPSESSQSSPKESSVKPVSLDTYLPVDRSSLDKSIVDYYRSRLLLKDLKKVQSEADEAEKLAESGESDFDRLYNTLEGLLGLEVANNRLNISKKDADLNASKLEEKLAKERNEDIEDAIRRYNNDLDEVNRAKEENKFFKDSIKEFEEKQSRMLLGALFSAIGGALSGLLGKLGGKLLLKPLRYVGKLAWKSLKGLGRLLKKPIKAAWDLTKSTFKRIGNRIAQSKPVKYLSDLSKRVIDSAKDELAKLGSKLANTKPFKILKAGAKKVKDVAKQSYKLAKNALKKTGKLFKRVGGKVGGKLGAKLGGKAAGKTLGKMLPGVGLAFGLYDLGKAGYDMYQAYKSGDEVAMSNAKLGMVGGAISTIGGAASFIPGVGTIVGGLLGAAGTATTITADVKQGIHEDKLLAEKSAVESNEQMAAVQPEASVSISSPDRITPEGSGDGEDATCSTTNTDTSKKNVNDTKPANGLIAGRVVNTTNNFFNRDSVVVIENRDFRVSQL